VASGRNLIAGLEIDLTDARFTSWQQQLEQMHDGPQTLASLLSDNNNLGKGYAQTSRVLINGGPLRETDEQGILWQRLCGGTVTIGSAQAYYNLPDDDPRKAESDEQPFTVALSTFDITTTEFTHSDYLEITGTDLGHEPELTPAAVNIDWKQARQACRSLPGNTDLPTEVQWEYAARAGSQTSWFWGDNSDSAEVQANDSAASWNDDLPVSRPNSFGLYDTTAGVLEWVRDGYESTPEYAKGNPLLPLDPLELSEELRVIRGGAFDFTARGLRSAFRLDLDPGNQAVNLGFRCVRVPSASVEPLEN